MNILVAILCHFDVFDILACHPEGCCLTWMAFIDKYAFPLAMLIMFTIMSVAHFGFWFYDWAMLLVNWLWNDDEDHHHDHPRVAAPQELVLTPPLATAALPAAQVLPHTPIVRPASVYSQASSHMSSAYSGSMSSRSSSTGSTYSSRTPNSTPVPSSRASSVPPLAPIPEPVPIPQPVPIPEEVPSPEVLPSPLPPQNAPTRRRRRRQ